MYRFRSVENLIGKYEELEKQQIYFASLDELNDPMEGKRRYYWQGEKIVWVNFLKHYLLCLEHVVTLSRLLPDNETITKEDIPIYKSEKDLPTQIYKERIQKINNEFFSDSFVQSYIQFLYENPNEIYSQELYIHLKVLSRAAFDAIFKVDAESGIILRTPISGPKETRDLESELSNVWDKLSQLPDYNVVYKQIMDNFYKMIRNRDAEQLYKFKDSPKQQSIFLDYPQMYLDAVVELTYPKAFVACFMDNCSNSSIWGTYGNNHTGVCLKFKTDRNSNHVLPLQSIVGYSGATGKISEYRDFSLKPMKYESSFEELDFFRNLGSLPIPQLKQQWYTDENGRVSVCSEDILNKEEEWRNQYWGRYEGAFLKKIPEWAHEREYRIILSSGLHTFDEPQNRLLEYKFEDLESIIFGIKTPNDAKTKIIEIIENKCRNSGRNQFNFFEMAYSDSKNELYPRPLLTLKFN